MRILLTAIVATTLLSTGTAEAQDNRNAVTWYQRAMSHLDKLSEREQELIEDYRRNPTRPPSAELRNAIGKMSTAMSQARRGARQNYSDYQLDYDQGYELMLPHLAPMRQMARIMQADAMIRMHDGDTAYAVAHIADLYQMGEHTASDRTMISSLVAQSIWDTGDTALQAAIDRGQIGADESLLLLQAATDLPTRDPFGMVEAVVMEQDIVLASLERHVLDEENGSVETLAMFLPNGADIPPELRSMTQDDLRQDLELYDEMMTKTVEIFAEGDAEAGIAAMKAMEQELGEGKYGVIAGMVAPAWSRVFKKMLEAEKKIQERIDTLTKLAAGEVNALAQANAAVWYLNAVEALRKKEQHTAASLKQLREMDAALAAGKPAPATPDELTAMLNACPDVYELLRQASRMKRCDFSFAWDASRNAPAVTPIYASGLRDLFRLLMVDIARQSAAQDPENTRDRLRLLWSMIVHLQGDPMFATAIMTRAAFNRVVRIVDETTRLGLLDTQTRSEFHGMANSVRRTDPFGYVAATIKAREDLTGYYYRTIPWDNAEREQLHKKIAATIKSYNGDLLMYVAVIMDTMRHAAASEGEATTDPLDGLGDVFDLEVLDQARSDVGRIAPLLASHDLIALAEQPVPRIASIGERMRQARGDLRNGVKALEVKKEQPPSGPR